MSIVRKADIRTGLTAALLFLAATVLQGCAGDLTMPDFTTQSDSSGVSSSKCVVVNGVLLCD